MKKLLLAVLFLSGASVLKADLGDQITASLIDHVSTHSQWTTKGDNRLVLLTDIIELGKMDGRAIGQIRFGYSTITNPDTTLQQSGYVGDLYANIAPFLRRYVSLNPTWAFLSSVEMGPSFAYDFAQRHSYASFSVGLAFGLQPK